MGDARGEAKTLCSLGLSAYARPMPCPVLTSRMLLYLSCAYPRPCPVLTSRMLRSSMSALCDVRY
eukprot:2088642-Rhodomonas_salina.5